MKTRATEIAESVYIKGVRKKKRSSEKMVLFFRYRFFADKSVFPLPFFAGADDVFFYWINRFFRYRFFADADGRFRAGALYFDFRFRP